MAPLRYYAKFDLSLSLDCAPCPPPRHNPRKGRDQILPSCNLAPRFGFACGVCADPAATRSEEVWVIGGWYVSQYLDVIEVRNVVESHYIIATLIEFPN